MNVLHFQRLNKQWCSIYTDCSQPSPKLTWIIWTPHPVLILRCFRYSFHTWVNNKASFFQSSMTLDGLDPAPRLNIEVALNQTYDWIWSVVCRRFTPILKRGRGAKHKTRNRIFLLVVFMRVDLCEITENQRPWFTSILKRGCGGQITKYEIRSLNKTHFDASRNLHFEKFAFWQFEKSILWELRILTAWEIDNLRNSQFSKCQNANSSNYWIIKMPKCEFLKM